MAKIWLWLKVPAQDLRVGDLVNFSSSQDPSERFHRVTEVTRTAPHYPIPGASAPCTVLITCGKRAKVHVPSNTLITTKR